MIEILKKKGHKELRGQKGLKKGHKEPLFFVVLVILVLLVIFALKRKSPAKQCFSGAERKTWRRPTLPHSCV